VKTKVKMQNQKSKNKNIFVRHNNSFSKKKNCYAGFTLIETLIAISVLLLSITGPMEIASKSLFSAFYARDQITAYYLAQEAIEYIKNARDNTFLYDYLDSGGVPIDDGVGWLDGLGVCIDDGGGSFSGCYVSVKDIFDPIQDLNNPNLNPIKACVGDCPKMSFEGSSGLWTQSGTPNVNDTKFVRRVEIIPQFNTDPVHGHQEAIIKVTVTWPTASIFGGNKTFELYGAMMNSQRK
jgi:type II secretory pathway pseudopilin PulG